MATPAATTPAIETTQDTETPATPAEATPAERPRIEHSYYELVAPDMTLDAMNVAERDYIQELAQSGDLEALKVIFRSMLADPERGARAINLPRQVRRMLIAASSGEHNALTREAYTAKADMVEAAMLGDAGNPSPLERLLIERAVTCWLAAELADMDIAHQEAGARHMPNPSKMLEYYARRQDRAHKRFLQSVDALARMRRLMSPLPLMAGQVNIAQPGAQQLNMVHTGE